MNRRRLLELLLACSLLVSGSHATTQLTEDYAFPAGLVVPGQYGVLQSSSSETICYDWSPGTHRVDLRGSWRASTADPWQAVESHERTALALTAIAPVWFDTLYVLGTEASGSTVIERWSISFGTARSPGAPSFLVERSPVLTSARLTHVQACAAAQDHSCLLALHHESREIWRIDLRSGATCTVLTPTQYPLLRDCGSIRWARHRARGMVFLVEPGLDGSCEFGGSPVLLLWHADHGENFTRIEEIPEAEWIRRGYSSIEAWYPDSTLYSFDQG